jgi:predicted ATP-dependent serine protease
MVMGELSLGGSVRPVLSVLPVALHARREGFAPLVVPTANAAGDEGQWVKWVKWDPECAFAGGARAGRMLGRSSSWTPG